MSINTFHILDVADIFKIEKMSVCVKLSKFIEQRKMSQNRLTFLESSVKIMPLNYSVYTEFVLRTGGL